MTVSIEQYVNAIEDFSSQYGSQQSHSFVARNLRGQPLPFSHAMDTSRGFSLSSYGNWGKEKPHFAPSFAPLNSHCSDFVDISFENPVLPCSVKIYQTFNGGSVARIWGSLGGIGWILLWFGGPTVTKGADRTMEIYFDAVEINQFINFLRIEMDPTLQEYFPSFDAVSLFGRIQPISERKLVFNLQTPKEFYSNYHGGEFSDMIYEGLNYITSKEIKAFNKKKKTIDHTSIIDSYSENCANDGGYFSLLPEEIMIFILRKTDLRTLSQVSRSCKLMYKYVSDPILFRYLHLQSCFQIVNDKTLKWLKTRCVGMKGLDISHCGNYGAVTTECFVDFIVSCGVSLQTLVMDNCDFVTDHALQTICNTCGSLKVLSLSGCRINSGDHFVPIAKLSDLYFLNLTRCAVRTCDLQEILPNMLHLKNLKLVDCPTIIDPDAVIGMLSLHNQELERLQIWKTKGLTVKGVRLLGALKQLEVVDLGWTFSGFLGDSLKVFLSSCPNLRVLSLTAWRNITDHDIMSIAKLGHNLEQVDLMGNRNITYDAIKYLLFSCQRLKLLDISYCDQIPKYQVDEWKEIFPRVVIKDYQQLHLE